MDGTAKLNVPTEVCETRTVFAFHFHRNHLSTISLKRFRLKGIDTSLAAGFLMHSSVFQMRSCDQGNVDYLFDSKSRTSCVRWYFVRSSCHSEYTTKSVAVFVLCGSVMGFNLQ